jgi:hypothetical protein
MYSVLVGHRYCTSVHTADSYKKQLSVVVVVVVVVVVAAAHVDGVRLCL